MGAAGGVGLTAVEISSHGRDCYWCRARSGKMAVAKAAGADHVIDASEDITAARPVVPMWFMTLWAVRL
jgi:NADPH2:quinone reductase